MSEQPWQMTRKQWDIEREKIRPNVAQSNFTRASGSQSVQRHNRLIFLLYGCHSTERYIQHRDVIAKALSERQPVPAHVLADYPELVVA